MDLGMEQDLEKLAMLVVVRSSVIELGKVGALVSFLYWKKKVPKNVSLAVQTIFKRCYDAHSFHFI